jgi:hypothetical protein
MAWASLPDGSDLSIQSGNAYAVVALVGHQHPRGPIINELQKRGLAVYSYAEGSGDPRPVTVAAVTSQASLIPWSPSFPASLVAHYQIQSAWIWPNVGSSRPQPPSSPDEAPSRPARATASLFFIGGAALGGLGWYLWKQIHG